MTALTTPLGTLPWAEHDLDDLIALASVALSLTLSIALPLSHSLSLDIDLDDLIALASVGAPQSPSARSPHRIRSGKSRTNTGPARALVRFARPARLDWRALPTAWER